MSPYFTYSKMEDLNVQDLTWLHIALKQFEKNNPEILAKCNTFEATVEKVSEALLTEAVKKLM